MSFNVVDLPDPEAPTIATRSPGRTLNETCAHEFQQVMQRVKEERAMGSVDSGE